jgi:excisionase family DNA binding protein
MSPLLTREQIAEHLQVSLNTVRAMVNRGTLPRPIKLGRNVHRWRTDDFMSSLARLGK